MLKTQLLFKKTFQYNLENLKVLQKQMWFMDKLVITDIYVPDPGGGCPY